MRQKHRKLTNHEWRTIGAPGGWKVVAFSDLSPICHKTQPYVMSTVISAERNVDVALHSLHNCHVKEQIYTVVVLNFSFLTICQL